MTLVSIAIPAYRRPNGLHQAISSVLAQDHEELEVLIGDDSGDLKYVADAFHDNRIIYRRNQTRLGLAGNWNRTLDACHGDLVGLLMDDDRLLPGFIPSTVSRFNADVNGRIGVVFTNHTFKNEKGDVKVRTCSLEGGIYDYFLPDLLRHKPVAVSGALMRREAWEDVRPLPDLQTADVVLHIKIALESWAFEYIDRPLMEYSVHTGQLSSAEMPFRDHGVRAWEQFQFDNDLCEELRLYRLGNALAARAASRIKNAQFDDAQEDLSRIESMGIPSSRRIGLLSFLSNNPMLAKGAVGMWKALRWMRARSS